MMDEKLTIWQSREKAEKKGGLDFRRFVHQNPEMVFRFMLLACALLIFVSCLITGHRTEVRLREEFRQELTAERFRVEQETLARVKEEYGINAQNAEKATMEAEAKTIAKILYPMRNNRTYGLRSACWCVFNRVDNVVYADNVYSVCSADQAFMGWSDSNPVLDDLYQIALSEVVRWHSGVRPMDNTFVFLNWTPKEIQLFDKMGNGAHYFYESDWADFDDAHAY